MSDSLDERLRRIEERLPHEPIAPPPVIVPPPQPPPSDWLVPPQSHATPARSMPPPLPVMPLTGEEPQRVASVEGPSRVVQYVTHPRIPDAPPQGDLERMIGLKWAGWFGAIVLVIGAALGFRYAYENGWLQMLPYPARLLLMSLAGFGLIAAGEVVLRRVNRISAAGLFGAGTAVLFLVSYAGYEWYGIYARGTAFTLMGVATIIGVAIAGRAGLVSIAVLSLIGGHLAPIILSARAESVVPFLFYLLFLQVLALALCAWGAERKWWVLRGLSLAAMMIWQLLLVSRPDESTGTVLTFAVIYAALFQAELILTTWRVGRRSVTTEAEAAAPADAPFDPNVGLFFSIFVTAQLTLVTLVGCSESTAGVRGTWVLAIAAVCLLIGLALPRVHAALARLSASLQIQTAGLLILAVPILFEGPMRIWGWLALSAVFAALVVLFKKPSAAAGTFISWTLAAFGLLWWGAEDEAWNWWLASPTPIAAVFLLAIVVAIAGHLLATVFTSAFGADEAPAKSRPSPFRRLVAFHSPMPDLAALLHAFATLVWISAAFSCLQTLAATVSLLLYATLACGFSGWRATRPLAYVAAGAVLTAAVKWIAIDELSDRLGSAASAATPFFNEHLAVGVLVAIALAAVVWLRRDVLLPPADHARAGIYRSALVLIVTLLLAFGLSVEIAQAVSAAAAAGSLAMSEEQTILLDYTILWTVAAAVVLAADRLIIRPESESIAMAMVIVLIVIGFKYVAADTLLSGSLSGRDTANLVLNLQTAAAIVCAGGLLLTLRWPTAFDQRSLSLVLLLLVILGAGSAEVSRYATRQSGEEWIIRQAGWSIWWSVFAIASVVAGFAMHVRVLRLCGLGLFGLTLLKVTIVDLSSAGTGWRILSFIGLGGLLLGTSVLYGRFGPKLMEK